MIHDTGKAETNCALDVTRQGCWEARLEGGCVDTISVELEQALSSLLGIHSSALVSDKVFG